MSTHPPRPDAALPARTVEWLAELERVGYHTGAIDALRSVLLDHQPATRRGRCRACRRVPWGRRRRFPCLVWFQIGDALLDQVAERGRHRAGGK
ncbi:MAG: hypothetical protein ACRDRW_09275 [Pseudonocardiaceae bacterium]